MWVLFAFLSALFAGLVSILAKCGTKDTDSTVLTAMRTVVVLIFSWIMAFASGSAHGIASIGLKPLLFLVLSGLATGASWLCYFHALKVGDVNKVVPIDKSSTVLTVILAFVILGEPISLYSGVGAVFIGVGTLLMIEKKDAAKPSGEGKSWLLYAVLSALFASLTAILGKVGISPLRSPLGSLC